MNPAGPALRGNTFKSDGNGRGGTGKIVIIPATFDLAGADSGHAVGFAMDTGTEKGAAISPAACSDGDRPGSADAAQIECTFRHSARAHSGHAVVVFHYRRIPPIRK